MRTFFLAIVEAVLVSKASSRVAMFFTSICNCSRVRRWICLRSFENNEGVFGEKIKWEELREGVSEGFKVKGLWVWA